MPDKSSSHGLTYPVEKPTISTRVQSPHCQAEDGGGSAHLSTCKSPKVEAGSPSPYQEEGLLHLRRDSNLGG